MTDPLYSFATLHALASRMVPDYFLLAPFFFCATHLSIYLILPPFLLLLNNPVQCLPFSSCVLLLLLGCST